MDYYRKYLKYKTKYEDLKKKIGGKSCVGTMSGKCEYKNKDDREVVNCYNPAESFCGKNGIKHKRGKGGKCSKEDNSECKQGLLCMKNTNPLTKLVKSHVCKNPNKK
jgi:hypothetical protein